jgi:hypothetical protein
MTRTRTLVLAGVLSLIASAWLAAPVSAQRDSRALYFGVGIGPHVLFDCCDVHARSTFEFGWHPSGNTTGFFLAATGAFTFGRDYFMFYGGARLGGDIEVYDGRDFAVLLRPSGVAAIGVFDYDGPRDGNAMFLAQAAFDVKFALLQRFLQVWVRPVAFDFMFGRDVDPHDFDNDDDFAFAYGVVGGVDFAF